MLCLVFEAVVFAQIVNIPSRRFWICKEHNLHCFHFHKAQLLRLHLNVQFQDLSNWDGDLISRCTLLTLFFNMFQNFPKYIQNIFLININFYFFKLLQKYWNRTYIYKNHTLFLFHHLCPALHLQSARPILASFEKETNDILHSCQTRAQSISFRTFSIDASEFQWSRCIINLLVLFTLSAELQHL